MGWSSIVRYAYLMSSAPCQSKSLVRVTLSAHWSWGGPLINLQEANFPIELCPASTHLLAEVAKTSASRSRYIFMINNNG